MYKVFKKILVANRGEIACRIIHTCRKLKIKTVAIYSEADENARHVKLADEAYLVGASAPQESYLNMDKILEVAQSSGAEAIHPGYGFLSENPTFARRCAEFGIKFIGPRPEVMEKMGDKLRARKLARKAGLPVLPGTDEAVEDHEALDRAWALGFPLMVKSAEGGGGIGIHIIESLDELLPIIERARSVASKAFGSPTLYFERCLKYASHIEVQIIGDEHGNVVHLFERDCSVQRRNQKLVEETPAVKLTPQLRQKICKLGLKLAKHIGYTNAGTVEFLVSQQGQIFFLEMNTRLQVEHGVTEMVTGLDLVELQLRVASGEELPIKQRDIQLNGHAIEVRVYPEDPDTFMPAIGIVTDLYLPKGQGVRVDTALCKGYEVTLHYEPLMAKIMAWGRTRKEATKRLRKALLAFRLEGVICNVALLQEILANEEFVGATHHTGSLAGLLERKQQKDPKEVAAAIGTALALVMQKYSASQVENLAPSPWVVYSRREQLRAPLLKNWR